MALSGSYSDLSGKSDVATLSTTQTISGAKTFSSLAAFNAGLNISGNLSAPQWGVNGIGLIINSGTYTDTTSTGTVANMAVHTINGSTINTSAATTFSNAATLYVAAPSTAGSLVTITNNYALRSGGPVLLDGVLHANGGLYSGTSSTNSNFTVASNTTATNTATAQFVPVNAGTTISTMYKRTCFYGNGLSTLASNSSYGSVIFGAAPIKESTTGTHTLLSNAIFMPLTVTDAAASTTNTATVYIDGAASATVTGTNYSLWSAGGTNRLDGTNQIAFSSKAGDPTATEIPAGKFMVWLNTSTGTLKVWANNSGTLKSVALS